jgi:hypothetical protein
MTLTDLKNVKHEQIGKLPVVILPLAQWKEVEAILEEHEMMSSSSYRESIAESRRQIKQGKAYHFNLQTGKFRKVRKP